MKKLCRTMCYFGEITMPRRITLFLVFCLLNSIVLIAQNNPNYPMMKDINVVIASNSPLNIINQPLINKGFLDVTKPPFNAIGDGTSDDTKAIQSAIDSAYENNLVVFFPGNGKVYKVSDQLNCGRIQQVSRKYSFQLVGSTIGARPIIKLAENVDNDLAYPSTITGRATRNFKLPDTYSIGTNKVVVLFQNYNDVSHSSDASSLYASLFRGINIDMGVTNTAYTAISMDGAQNCTIEDIKITGTGFAAGVLNLPGSGGGVVNLSIDGGQIGINQASFRPNPTVTGLELTNQSQYGIRLASCRGPLIITGFTIKSTLTPSSTYRAIYAANSSVLNYTSATSIIYRAYANLSLQDGSIEVSGATSTIAIENIGQDVTMNNVYFKSNTIIKSGSALSSVAGDALNWKKVANYTFTTSGDKSSLFYNTTYQNPTMTTDIQYPANPAVTVISSLVPTDFTTMHSWGIMPSFEDTRMRNGITESNVVDITEGLTIGGTLYKATTEANTLDDDWPAIQAIINDVTNPSSTNYQKIVFIPRGFFYIKQKLVLPSGLKMIGASTFNSLIVPFNDWADPNGVVLVESSSVTSGSLVLGDFCIISNYHTQALHIQTPNSIIKNIAIENIPGTASNNYYINPHNCSPVNPGIIPVVQFDNNASGKVYTLVLNRTATDCDFTSGQLGTLTSDYNLLKVTNTKRAITFYQISIEHLLNAPMVKFRNSDSITVFGFKFESNSGSTINPYSTSSVASIGFEVLEISNSKNINIVGGSGNYNLSVPGSRGLIAIQNSQKIKIQNMDRKLNDDVVTFDKPVWINYDGNDLTGNNVNVLQFEYTTLYTLIIK